MCGRKPALSGRRSVGHGNVLRNERKKSQGVVLSEAEHLSPSTKRRDLMSVLKT